MDPILLMSFLLLCTIFVLSVFTVLQLRSNSASPPPTPTPTPNPTPTPTPSTPSNTALILAIILMILSGVAVLLIWYIIVNQQTINNQYLGTEVSDTCDETTCSEGPQLGSMDMTGVSIFDDSEYDV